MSETFSIDAQGPFDLHPALQFLEGWPAARGFAADAEVLRYATSGEDDWSPVGVEVAPARNGVKVTTSRPAPPDLRAQIARTLSLDVDGRPFAAMADDDGLIAGLQRNRPGLRPIGFWSPWEASIWALLTQRSSGAAARATIKTLSERYGEEVKAGSATLQSFPGPQDIIEAAELPGVWVRKQQTLRALADAALDGLLTGEQLRAMDPEEASGELQRIPGVGPYSAALIIIRGAGHPDFFTAAEPKIVSRIEQVYGVSGKAAAQATAESWRPFRSWVAFLLRSAAL